VEKGRGHRRVSGTPEIEEGRLRMFSKLSFSGEGGKREKNTVSSVVVTLEKKKRGKTGRSCRKAN